MYAADSDVGADISHTQGDTVLVAQTGSTQHNDEEHHAHHGCHFSLHMIGLICESISYIMPVDPRNSYMSLTKTYISRLSVPPTKPPRS